MRPVSSTMLAFGDLKRKQPVKTGWPGFGLKGTSSTVSYQ